jgi:hypothetical protein
MCLAHLGVSVSVSSFYHPVRVSPHICLIKAVCNSHHQHLNNTFPTRDVVVALRLQRQGALVLFPRWQARTRNAVAQHSKGHLVSLTCSCFPPPSACLYRLLWFEVSQPGQPDSPSLHCRQSVILCSTCSLLRAALRFCLTLNHRRSIVKLAFVSTNSIP